VVGPSVKQSTAETQEIDVRLTSIICEGGQRWRNRVVFCLFENFFFELPLPRLSKKKVACYISPLGARKNLGCSSIVFLVY
jgi:hypothetical protein